MAHFPDGKEGAPDKPWIDGSVGFSSCEGEAHYTVRM